MKASSVFDVDGAEEKEAGRTHITLRIELKSWEDPVGGAQLMNRSTARPFKFRRQTTGAMDGAIASLWETKEKRRND